MGFLTSFPPYLSSPCSYFRKQKQRRKTSSASLEFNRESEQGNDHNQLTEQRGKGFRSRLVTVGPTVGRIMQSYNRHIRNQSFSRPTKQNPPNVLSSFESVLVSQCTHQSARNVPTRRQSSFCECCPIARSGHRIFADQDYIYVLGGYNQVHSNDKTYTDAWRFNRLTQQWQECVLADPATPLPNTLASFSLFPLSPANPLSAGPNEVYIFGGTGFPFGQEATNSLHRVRINANGKIHIQLEESVAAAVELNNDDENRNMEEPFFPTFPPRMYGHAMCYRLETDKAGFPKETIYLAGGTTGHIYSMDIWKLERPAIARDAPWKATMLNANGFETGRYRLEAVLHGNVLFTFGGGAPEYTAEFNELLTFNLTNKKFELIKTQADPVFGIPRGRKCHSLLQHGHSIYIIGGCRDIEVVRGRPEHQIINDVWRFDLDTLAWTRVRTTLPIPVYFHSAAVTPDGCVFVFGGCVDEDPHTQTRVNRLQRMWLSPPSLKYFASTSLIENMPKSQRRRLTNMGFRLSDTETLISHFSEATGLAA